MSTITASPAFAAFAAVLIVEVLKTLFLGMATPLARLKHKAWINQEDADWLGGKVVELDHPDAARRLRVHRNNLENLVPFFIVGCLFLWSGASATLGLVYFGAFLLGRLAHTYAYLGKKAMLRRNAYTLGFVSVVAMGVHTAVVLVQRLL